MSALATAPTPTPGRRRHAGYLGSLRSEAVKFRGLRSSWILLGITLLLLVGISLLAAWAVSYAANNDEEFSITAEETAGIPGSGFLFAQLLLISLGVVFVTGEWSSGASRTSLLAVDHRSQFFAGKATIAGLAALVVTLLSGVLGTAVALPFFRSADVPYEPTGSDALWYLGTLSLCAVFVILIGVGIGFLLRNAAGGIVTGIALLVVLPIVLAVIPWSKLEPIAEHLPMNAMSQLSTPNPGPEALGHTEALITMLLWVGGILALGLVRLTRTDI